MGFVDNSSIASSKLERFLVNGKGARHRQSGRARRRFIGVKLLLSELETRFFFVDALIISRSMLVELHLPLNCHLTVVPRPDFKKSGG